MRARAWATRAGERQRGLRAAGRLVPRWAAGLAAAGLVGLAVVLAVVGVPEPIAGVGDVFANLGRNLVTAAVLGAIAWLWLYSWTSARATRRLRDDARMAPHELFPIRPRVGSASRVVGREQLVADVAANLAAGVRTGPQLIVGETGSGKTSVLLKLAEHFAERDVLPIVLNLRGLAEIDFAELAKARFAEYVDPHLRSADEAEKLWRWLCRRGKVLVLADDLDRAELCDASDPYRLAVRIALDGARRRDLPLVVASRPPGVPPDLPEPPIELGALEWGGDGSDLERAVATVLERAGRREDPGAERLARANLAAGEVLSNAFYVGVVTELLRAGSLREPPPAGPHAARVGLLDCWRERILGGETAPEPVRARRDGLLRALEAYAADRLPPPGRRDGDPAPVPADALHFGEVAGFLELEEDGTYRFAHEVLHAYFAARALPRDEPAWRRAVELAPDSPRVQLALVIAAAASGDAAFCEAAAGALLAESRAVADEQRLLRAAAAAEVARAGGFHGLDDRIAAECVAARADASAVAKRVVLDQLGELSGEGALLALWRYGDDADYGVRWGAARKLVERCRGDGDGAPARDGVLTGAAAYAVVGEEVRRGLAVAARCLDAGREPDDWEPEILPLKHMGWMLPPLRTRARLGGDGALAEEVGRDLAELLRLEAAGVTRQKGLEASIAQGFKADALMHPGAGVDEDAGRLLARPGAFWYSQLNLIHAVTLRARSGDGSLDVVRPFADEPRHPFVRAAAGMCVAALERPGEDLRRWVWDDESVVVAARPRGLDPAAIQLVGDLTLLLNLNETGNPEQREAFGGRDVLPHCMAGSRTRLELFDERHPCTCEFRLCPYVPAAGRMSAHRDLSRPFCRHQRLHATPANARRWGSRVGRRALRDVWRRLESLARG
jgi:hypothetical protein